MPQKTNNPKLTPARKAAIQAAAGSITIVTNTGLGIILTPALARQIAENLGNMARLAETLAPSTPYLDPTLDDENRLDSLPARLGGLLLLTPASYRDGKNHLN